MNDFKPSIAERNMNGHLCNGGKFGNLIAVCTAYTYSTYMICAVHTAIQCTTNEYEYVLL